MGTIWRDQIPAISEKMAQNMQQAEALRDVEVARERERMPGMGMDLEAADEYIMRQVGEVDGVGEA